MVEYAGELMESPAAAKEREDFYASDAATGCYMYYFKHGDKQYWWVNHLNSAGFLFHNFSGNSLKQLTDKMI